MSDLIKQDLHRDRVAIKAFHIWGELEKQLKKAKRKREKEEIIKKIKFVSFLLNKL